MDTTTLTLPENHPAFTEAARKALRHHPCLHVAGHSLEIQAEAISGFLSTGDPGAVVMVWSREFAADMLVLLDDMDNDERVAKLREAIESCISFRDNLGTEPTDTFYTNERRAIEPLLAKLADENPVTVPAPVAAPPVVEVVTAGELHLRELLQRVYMAHGDAIPAEAVAPEYEGWAYRYSQPVQFDDIANLLYHRRAGYVVSVTGREYAKYIVAALEQDALFELCPLMQRAIKEATCPFDDLGTLPYDAGELNNFA